MIDRDHINHQWANGGPSSIVVLLKLRGHQCLEGLPSTLGAGSLSASLLAFGMVQVPTHRFLDHTSNVGKTQYIISINKPSPSHHHFYRW